METVWYDLRIYAEEEADEIVSCFIKFRKKHSSCLACDTSDFCEKLATKLKEWAER